MLKTSLFLILIVLTLGNRLAFAQESQNFKPQTKPFVKLQLKTAEIELDGELNDLGWRDAARITGFSETNPGDGTKPPVKTEVLITYDENFLFLGFLCYDDHPDKIRATLSDRDQMWSDDYVGILIDSYGDANLAFFIFSNPLGVQGDTRFSPANGEDSSFDLIYDTEAQITENGYQVEMAIPFSSLRFPDTQEQNWRVNFWRTHPRQSRSTYSWSYINRDEACFLCQFGTLSGLQDVKPGKNIELLPAIVASQSGELNDADDPESDFKNNDISGEASLGIKWTINPSLSVEATYNPDFSQVESDAAQIDVNQTFALFYPEKRPFFHTGGNLFRTWVRIVYTRSINDPLTAAKLVGRWGNSTMAYLGALDENTPVIIPLEEKSEFIPLKQSLSNIVRYKQSFWEQSYIGALVSDRRFEEGGGGTNISLDGLLQFHKNYNLEFQFVFSSAQESNDTTLTPDLNDVYFNEGKHTVGFDGESFSGYAAYLSIERNARHWNFDIDYKPTSPTFRAYNGFIRQANMHRLFAWTEYTFYSDSSIFERITPNFEVARFWNFQGQVKDEWIQPQLRLRFIGQTDMGIGYLFDNEHYKGNDYKGINRWRIWVDSQFSEPFQIGFWLQTGRYIANRWEDIPVKGHGTDLEVWGSIKPFQQLILRPSFVFSEMYRLDNDEEVFNGYIFRLRTNMQFTKELFLRLILQYNTFNERVDIEPLLSYKLNPFSIFYIGSTHDFRDFKNDASEPPTYNNPGWHQTSRQYFMKFQYLFSL